MKSGAMTIRDMADVVIHDGAPEPSIDGKVRKFSRDEMGKACLEYVVSLVSKELADERKA